MQLFAATKWFILPCKSIKKAWTKNPWQAYCYELKVMKVTALILLIASLQLSANSVAQENITLKAKGASLFKIFTDIKRQTGYNFFLAEESMQQAKPVDIDVKNASLKTVLEICFKNQPFTYSISGKNIIITIKKNERNDTQNNAVNAFLEVKGKVVNAQGEPIARATVMVKGTSKSTITDVKGEFSIGGINDDVELIISSVGFEQTTISTNGRSFIQVVLQIKVTSLDEFQVIGYGTTTKRLNTGNVTSIKSTDIEKQPVQNPLLALQGRVPGLFITQPSGLAGSSVRVRIQGQNSIANGNEPLYVIDGVPIISELPMTGIDGVLGPTGPNYSGFGNPLNYINVADIESIEVLKDADATSIYGSRAANGAILITTKKGKAGPMKLDLNMQTGWGHVTRKLDMLDTRQYLDMRYEAFRNDGINWKDPFVSANDLKVWDTTRYTNWQKELIGNTAHYSNISANISGGTATVQYLLGGTYHKETTVFPISNDFADTKISVNSSLVAASVNQKIKIQFTGSFMFDKNQLPRIDFTQSALLQEPNAPALFNLDGTINWAPDAAGNSTFGGNPMISTLAKYWNKTNNLISNIVLSYKVLPGLEIKNSIGYNKMLTDDFKSFPLTAAPPERRSVPGTQRSAEYGNRNINSWIIEPQLSYKSGISKGRIELLIGGTLMSLNTDVRSLRGTGHLSDELLENINASANISNLYASKSEYKYNAGFGRLNYNWLDKYIINLTARRDGSSRFGSENQFHNFGSIGGGWLFSNEGFVKENFNFLSFGKFKGSYGTTGNDQIGDYSFLSLYSYPAIQVPYQGVVSIMPASLPNPHLQWEETRKVQFGLELGFMQDRLFLNITYARNRSSNQLLNYQVPSVAGFSSYLTNFPAIIQNRNWEFVVNSKNIATKDFDWTSNFNLTIPQNKLISFPDLVNSSYSNLLVVDQSINVQRLLHYIGVDPTSGKYFFESKTDPFNPKYPDDYTLLINIDPKYYGGFQNTVSYKQFELDFLFQFVKQIGYNDATFWNGNRTPGSFFEGLSNQPVSVLDRWQTSGDNSSIGKFSSANNFLSPIISSDYRFTDASFIRLKNVSLSWELPNKWINKAYLKKCRIYAHGQNLLTITNYKGLDPENKSILSPTLPPLRVIMVGVQVGF